MGKNRKVLKCVAHSERCWERTTKNVRRGEWPTMAVVHERRYPRTCEPTTPTFLSHCLVRSSLPQSNARRLVQCTPRGYATRSLTLHFDALRGKEGGHIGNTHSFPRPSAHGSVIHGRSIVRVSDESRPCYGEWWVISINPLLSLLSSLPSDSRWCGSHGRECPTGIRLIRPVNNGSMVMQNNDNRHGGKMNSMDTNNHENSKSIESRAREVTVTVFAFQFLLGIITAVFVTIGAYPILALIVMSLGSVGIIYLGVLMTLEHANEMVEEQ